MRAVVWNHTRYWWSILILWISVQLTHAGRARDRRKQNRLAGPRAYMCYTCTSLESVGCGVNFNITREEAIRCIEGAVCYTLHHTLSGVYSRGCSSEWPPQLLRCYDEEIDDEQHLRCYCKGHYCNGAPAPLHPALASLLLLPLFHFLLLPLVTSFSAEGAG